MVAQLRRAVPGIAIVAGILLPIIVSSCDKVPLLAPTGTVINLFATANTVSLNTEMEIIATAIENGSDAGSGTTAGSAAAGTPVQNGTLISFTTTIGRIEPSEARTHNGEVRVKLITAAQSGSATITAFSGGASKALTLAVGTAAAGRVTVTSNPQTLGSSGGTATISAFVTDTGGAGVGGIPVTFTTNAGTLSSSVTTTDASGVATTTLTTSGAATVSVNAGGASGTVQVGVTTRAITGLTVSPQPASVGQVVTFTPTIAAGANISGGTLDFGDGSSAAINAVGTAIPHIYRSAQIFTAVATVNSAGGAETVSTPVVVGALGVTVAPTTAVVNVPQTFTATFASGGATPVVSRFVFTFDDGTVDDQGGANTDVHTFRTAGVHSVVVTVFGLDGSQIATGRASVNVTQ